MRKLTTEDFITKAKQIHGDKYDYSLVDYKNNSSKINIICSNCGSSLVLSPSHHLRGQGCRLCSIKRYVDSIRFTTEDFITKANQIHGDKYDYSLVDYKNKETKVIIICPIHGEFSQKPSNHWRYGCNKCGYEKAGEKQKHSYESIIDKANQIHSEKYSYIISNSIGYIDKATIICPVHGEFTQKVGNHIYKKYGCPKCASHISKQEIELQEWISQYVDITTNNRSIIPPLELDIVIPSHNIAIEYNGIYWHGEQRGKGKKYHLNKYQRCKDTGYRLIQVWENEWVYKKDIVKSIILTALGVYERKVHGRKCKIININSSISNNFYTNNHIQGFQSGKHHALVYDNDIVSMMTVKYYKDAPVLERFVNKKNVLVNGGFSKLLKSFDNIDNMTTFSDPRYFTGNVYEKNGFVFDGMIKPNYWYFKLNTVDISHRRRFQRKKIQKDNNMIFDDNLTEYENMILNGYDRIWDCGNMKYVYA